MPSLWTSAHVLGGCLRIVIMTSGFVITKPGPQTLQTGKPGFGGGTGFAVTGDIGGRVVIGANVPGVQPHGAVN